MLHRDENGKSQLIWHSRADFAAVPPTHSPPQCWRIPGRSNPAPAHGCSQGISMETAACICSLLPGTSTRTTAFISTSASWPTGIEGSSARPPALRLANLIPGEGLLHFPLPQADQPHIQRALGGPAAPNSEGSNSRPEVLILHTFISTRNGPRRDSWRSRCPMQHCKSLFQSQSIPCSASCLGRVRRS